MGLRPERIEVLAIGDELLDGRVADTNTLQLAHMLQEIGLAVAQRTTLTDDFDAILREARAVVARGTELCVVSGGLGPTRDDLTSEAFARLAGVDLVRDAAQAARIEEILARLEREVTDNQLKQADRPRGAEVIPNPVGTAPGFAMVIDGCRFVAVPGVPREFRRLVEDAVVAPLTDGSGPVDKRTLVSFGLIEAEVDRRLEPLAARWPSVRVGFRAHYPTIHVSLRAPRDEVVALEDATAFVREQLGRHVYAERDVTLAEVVVTMLKERQATLALAESCTGGLIGDLITDVPGSSAVFTYGAVTYANDAKENFLGVPSSVLEEHGAVSEACVAHMAIAARERAGTTYGIGVSGIAGPGGGTKTKPVGSVWIAVAGPASDRRRQLTLPFDRRRNKLASAYAALDGLRRFVLEEEQEHAGASR